MLVPRATKLALAAPPTCASVAGLRYATDGRGALRRVKSRPGFRYVTAGGRSVTDEATLKRIRRLVIPPAWTDVWIACDPRAHLQATGRDARGRKYRYHPRWSEVRHLTKYDRMVPFAQALPRLRRHVTADLRRPAFSKTKVIGAVAQLLEKTLIRIGNPEYARSNKSFGLTTLRDGHVESRGTELRFEFRGKSGVRHSVTFSDARLAKIVKRCQDLPGQELFQYVDEAGRRRPVTSADVNAYLRQAAGREFTAKDFRTWAGTLLAATALSGAAVGASKTKAESIMPRAVEEVSRHLGNTPTVCRACSIHPAILESYADGTLAQKLASSGRTIHGLAANECAVLVLLGARREWRGQLAEAARVARVA